MTRYLSPSRLAYTSQLGTGQYIMPDFMPDWALRYSGRGGLVDAMERGREFAAWVDKDVSRKQAGGQADLQQSESSPIYDMIGRYRAELPLKGTGMQTEWWGSADILINTKNGPVIGDFKLHGKWDPSQYEPSKYAPQLTAYQAVFQEQYGSSPDLATIHVSQATWDFLHAALEDPESGVRPEDILDELTNSTNTTHWTSGSVANYATARKSTLEREVLYNKTAPTEAPRMQGLIDAHKRYDEAVEAATGMTRSALRNATSSEPLEEDKERMYAFMNEVHFRAQMYASGVYSDVNVVREFVDKAKPILPGYSQGGTVRSTLQDYGQVKSAPQEQRGVAPYDPLRNQSEWKQLDPRLGDTVLWRPGTGEVAITHQREGAYGRDAYWRGTIERMGDQVAINGRLLVPQQLSRHDVKEGQRLPGTQWEEPGEVLPAIFSKAAAMIQQYGGGVNAAKAITQHMNQALQPMPSVRSDVFSTSAARMAYSQGLMGLQSGFSVRQQFKAMEAHRALRSGSRQSFDLRQLAEAAGFAYDPQKDIFYGGEAKQLPTGEWVGKAGSIYKRTRAGMRVGELVMPTKQQGTTRVWDADRMMISPLVQRDPTGKGQVSRYGPEVGIRARAAMFAHGGLMSEGMGYGSRQFLGMGDDQMWSQRISDTIAIEGDVGFTGLDQAYFDKESGGFVIGYIGNDPNNKVVWSKQKWDRFDLESTPTVRKEGGKTFIDLQGMVSSRGGSGQLKAWGGNKAMLTAIANINELFGNNLGKDLDVVLPKAKNVRQFAHALVSAKYQNDPVALAKAIYGEDRWKQHMVYEQMEEGAGGIQLGGQATERLQEIRGRMQRESGYRGVLMPLDVEDQERLLELGKEIAKEGMQANSMYRMAVTPMERAFFEKSGIVVKSLGRHGGTGKEGVQWIEAQVPAVFADVMMQVGREIPGQAQVSTEELLNLSSDPAGIGDEYRRAVVNKILPNIMRASGHYRKMYSDILTARMHTRREAGVEVGAERIIDLADLRAHIGDPGRNTSEFLANLGSLDAAKGKYIRIGEMLLPPVETLAALQVPDDPAKTMHWLNEDERRKYAIDVKDVSAITNSFMRLVEKGLDADALAKLEQSLYGTGLGGQKLGLAMTPAVAKGVMAARLTRGGIEGAAVSFTGVDDNVIILGKEKLAQMFGTDDYNIVNQAIRQGACAAIQRRPNVFPELSSMVGVRIESADSDYAKTRGIPGDFSGMAFGRMIAGMLFGDYDGDRVMALLTSTIAQSGGDVKDKTDAVVKYAASQRGQWERWATGMAHIMGHEDARALVGRKTGEDYTAEDLLKLNIMMGKEYSEVYKMLADLTEDQQSYIGAMLVPKAQRGEALADMFLNKFKFMAGVSSRDLRNALEGEAVSKEETSRAYNRLLREMHGYISETGEGDPRLAATFGFRAYQKTLDLSGFSEGLRSYLNVWEGYNAWGKGKSLQERLGPVGAEGQIPSRAVRLYALRDDLTVELMRGMLSSEELWGSPGGAKGYKLADDDKARWSAQAAAISSDTDTQKAIYKVLSEGGGAQDIWDRVYGEGVTATSPTMQARERFTKFWSNAGWLMGAPAAATFSRMKRSMYAGDMATIVERTAEWDRLNRLTGGQMERLAGVGRSMSAQTAVLSGRGGQALPENIQQFPNVPGSEVIKEMLGFLDENIPKRQPPGEIADLLRYITGGEDDLLKSLEALGVDAQSLSESLPALRSMVEQLQSPEMGYKEGQWEAGGLVPRVLSEWSQKATGEGGLGAVLRQLSERQAGGRINPVQAFRYAQSEGYLAGPSAGIAHALGLTSAGAAPLALHGGEQQRRAAVGGVAGRMQSRQAAQGQARAGGQMDIGTAMQTLAIASGDNEQALWGLRRWFNEFQFGGEQRQPISEKMRGFQAKETFMETYGAARAITGARETGMALAEKRMGIPGAGSTMAAMSMLEKTGDVTAATQLMPELTEEHVERLQGMNDALEKWQETVAPAVEGGRSLTKTQMQYTQALSKSLTEVPQLRMLAEAGIGKPGEQGRLAEHALGLTQRLQGAGGALAPAQAQIEQQRWQELQGEVGGRADIGRLFKALTGGWEMMRMQRMWGLTGGQAMAAVQPAAQEQMLAMQAAGMGAPASQFQMGGLAEGILTTRARKEQMQLGMGRAAGRAYGPIQSLLAQPGIGEAAGIALPGVGAGLMTQQLAGLAGIPRAGLLGLGVGAVTTGVGLYNYLQSSTDAQQVGAIAKAGRGELSLDMLASATGRRMLLRAAQGGISDPWTRETETDKEMVRRALTIQAGELGGLNMGERAQAIQYAYKEAAPEWMEQSAAEQLAGQVMQYSPEWANGNIQDLYRSRTFRQMASRGENVEQFVKMAGQWGGGPEAWQQYQQFYSGVAPSRVAGMEYTAGQWAGLRTGYGAEGLDILGAAASPFETTADREKMARVAGKFSDALTKATGGLFDFGDVLTEAVEGTQLQAERLTTLQASQFEQVSGVMEQARMMGLQTPETPERMTGAWVEQQYREQMPLVRARLGTQQQLMGMGLGMTGAGAAAEQFQTTGQLQMFQRFLGGDSRIMSMLGQASVQGPFEPNVPIGYGMNVNAGAMRGQFLGGIRAGLEGQGFDGQYITQSMNRLSQAFDDLRPVIETDTGLRMGTTGMWQGWAQDVTGGAGIPPGRRAMREGYLERQGMQLPEIGDRYGAVDEHRFQRFADILQDTGTRGIQAQKTTLQNQFQEFQTQQRAQSMEWSRVSQLGGTFEEPGLGEISTRGTLEITKELRSLGRLWEDFSSTYQERSREVSRAQFLENWDVRAARMPTQFGWQREDLAYQGAQSSLQFGWQMEDIQEGMRFATGRDRRKLQRQQERATIQYSMGMGRLDTMGERLDTREQWAEEDLERQKRHFLERNALQDDYQARYRSHIESRRQLEDELYAVQEYGAQFQLKQAEELFERQTELNEQMKAINAVMMAYNQSLENANAQMGQVVQMVQFLFSNLAVGGGGGFNLPDAAAGFFATVQSGFASAAASVQLPYNEPGR